MSLSHVYTRALYGVESPSVRVETHLSNGLPSFTLVGLPETAVKESRERVRCAIINSGFEFPVRRVTVNLAPADLPKEGGRYDLAIAIGILVASGQLEAKLVQDCEFIAELALSGDCASVRGVLPAIISADKSADRVFIASEDGASASLLGSSKIALVDSLLCVVMHLKNPDEHPLQIASDNAEHDIEEQLAHGDLSEVKGQYAAKHALSVAAAGGHNVLFYGPPGTGKSMLASRILSILPDLQREEALELASIYTLMNLQRASGEWYRPPYRSPHHSASATAIVGGGAKPRPGEISLAHRGVLFLDELPEFSRQALEMLREPLETSEVSISRAQARIVLPANFQLIAAMNPCPCGYLGHPVIACKDSPQSIAQYRRKLSGPLLDRIDMHVEVPFQSARITLSREIKEQTSQEVKAHVVAARALQWARQGCLNTDLKGEALEDACALDATQMEWLITTIDRLSLSSRVAHRIMRLARTLADMDDQPRIANTHLAQALRYRPVTN